MTTPTSFPSSKLARLSHTSSWTKTQFVLNSVQETIITPFKFTAQEFKTKAFFGNLWSRIWQFITNLQAVDGKPPNKVTGRWGAVGQIHLICILLLTLLDKINPTTMSDCLKTHKSSQKLSHVILILTFGSGRVSKRVDQLQETPSQRGFYQHV